MTRRTHKITLIGALVWLGLSAIACANLADATATLAPALPAAMMLAILLIVSVVVMPFVFLIVGLHPKFDTQAVATNDGARDELKHSPYFIAA